MTSPTTTNEDKDVVEALEEEPPPVDETREKQHRYLISALLRKQERTPSPLVVEEAPDESTMKEKYSKEAPPDSDDGASTTPAPATSTTSTTEESQEQQAAPNSPPPAQISTPAAHTPTSSSKPNITKEKIASPPEAKKRSTPRQNIDSTSRRAMALQHQWEDMFRRLMLYKSQHGDCLVPNRYSNDRQLGAWVSTQRRNFGKGVLAAPRKARLDNMGFVWKTSDPRATPWTQRYDELVEFYKSFGHSIVPILFDANRPLANWVSCQRQEYRYFVEDKPSRMTTERIKLLSKVDFVWDALRHRAPSVAAKILDEKKITDEDREDMMERNERPVSKKNRQEQAPRPKPRPAMDARSRAIEAHREAVEAQRKAVEAQRRAERAQRTLEREEAAEAAAKIGDSIMIHVGEDEEEAAGSNFGSNARNIWGEAPQMDEAARLHHREEASIQHSHILNGAMHLAAGPSATRFFQKRPRPGFSDEEQSQQDQATPQAALSSALDQQDVAGTSRKKKKNNNQTGDQKYSPQAYAEQSPPFAPMPVTSTMVSVPQPRPPNSIFYEQQALSPPRDHTAIYVPHNAHPSMSQQQVALMMAQHQQQSAAAGHAPNRHLMTATSAIAAEQTRHQQHMLRNHHHASLMNSAMAQQQQFNMAMAARNAMFQQQQQQQQHSQGTAAGLGNLDAATILHLQRGGSFR
jgi:hypothetical protein